MQLNDVDSPSENKCTTIEILINQVDKSKWEAPEKMGLKKYLMQMIIL